MAFKNECPVYSPFSNNISYLLCPSIILDKNGKINNPAGRRGHDRISVRFTVICALSAYHHQSCEFGPVQARCTRYNII